jgi:hypothetical protein
VVVREGQALLLRQRDAPLLVVDGEPRTFRDGGFPPHPSGITGWEVPESFTPFRDTAGVSLDAPLGAWVTSEHYSLRAGPMYTVHQHEGERWKRIDLRKGLVTAYYAAFEERDGALLALRSWFPDPEEEANNTLGPDDLEAAYPAKLERAMAKTTQAWVTLAGPKSPSIPQIPKDMMLPGGATTTSDGTLWALAEAKSRAEVAAAATASVDEQAAAPRPRLGLLMWPPGQTNAEHVDVPGLADARDVALHGSGDWALVTGATDTERYLALGRGTEWQRIPVSLPIDANEPVVHLSAAARLPDGELWIALPYLVAGGDGPPVWRKPVDGSWQPVPLPEVRSDLFEPSGQWARHPLSDQWIPSQRPQGALKLVEVPSLVWAANAIWLVAGASREQLDTDPIDSSARALGYSVVLTTLPGDALPTLLPPTWQVRLEHRNERNRAAKPGQGDCSNFTIVLGPGSLVDPSKPEHPPAFVSTLAERRSPPVEGSQPHIVSIYTTKRDAGEVLVAEAYAYGLAEATALRDMATRVMSDAGAATTITIECSIPFVERMIVPPSER